jgi:very-short-patch-repair endonuclease
MKLEKASRTNHFHYNKRLRPLANNLRKNLTKSEACLWKYLLSNRQMMGYQFRRQRPILNYIADFVCLDLLLIIEVDGITHDDEIKVKQDRKRDNDLAEIGFTTLRFSSWEVLKRMEDVAADIMVWIRDNAEVPPPSPRQRD